MPAPKIMAAIHCLGGGLVGSYVAKKMAEDGHEVHAYDPRPHKVEGFPGVIIHRMESDEDPVERIVQLHEPTESSLIDDSSIVVNMLPGDIGHISTARLSQKHWRTIDLSFSEETPDRLQMDALQSGATILWDTGIAPGLSNMLLAIAQRELGELKSGIVRVGGNPAVPTSGWSYMAPFSPVDVIAEYTRPARVIRESKEVSLPAISERHLIQVPGKGEMEAFLTDGLRSVLKSITADELSEYTVRWPGHIQKFIDMRDSGQIRRENLEDEWKYRDEVPEFTWMEVIAEGMSGDSVSWNIQDHGGDDGHSMARCTGLVTLCCIQEWLKDPEMLPPGVHPPEALSSEIVGRIVSRMTEEGIEISKSEG